MLFLRWAYGVPSRIFVWGAPNNTDPIYATSGVKQGDPLGPLLFALAIVGPLHTVAAVHPQAHVVAYFDDINVVGPVDSAVRAFVRLTTEVLSVGLTPVPSKCGCTAAIPIWPTPLLQSWALRNKNKVWLLQARPSVPTTL
jgi:hypothetical protein